MFLQILLLMHFSEKKKFLEFNRRNMREFHRYNLKFNANGLVKDKDKAPLDMIWPDLIANLNNHSNVKSKSHPFEESWI